jgi:hypothetical protein
LQLDKEEMISLEKKQRREDTTLKEESNDW